jgi:SAM-dependent methyltransferase
VLNGRAHWTRLYHTTAPDQVSWYQADPARSLALIRSSGIPLDAPLLDVGAGASRLADALIAAGYRDITLLDIAAPALAHVRARLGGHSAISFLVADLLTFTPTRRYRLWHDRAVFHFLTDPADRAAYCQALARALEPAGHLIVATFAESEPPRCSGLEVRRYSGDALVAEFGAGFRVRAVEEELHTTPNGGLQRFQYAWLEAVA